MVGEDTVRMSMKELKRVYVIRQAMAKARRQREAGEVPGVTARQVRRLIQRVRVEGDAGLVHRSRGRPSNRQRGEVGRAAWDHAQCGDVRGMAAAAGDPSISPAASAPTGRGGRAKRMRAPCCRWMARTMRGLRTAARPVS